MTKQLTLNRLLSVLERTFTQLPDERKGENTTCWSVPLEVRTPVICMDHQDHLLSFTPRSS